MPSNPFDRSPRCRARRAGLPRFGWLAFLCIVAGIAAADSARAIIVPLRVDDAFLRARLVEQLFTEAPERTPPWRDASGCTKVVLSEPTVASREDALHVGARFEATLSAGTGGFCLGAIERRGFVHATLVPYVVSEPDRAVVAFRVVNSELLDDDGEKRFTGAVWDALGGLVHPRLETLRLDVGAPVAEVRAFLSALQPAADPRAERFFDSLALQEVLVQPGGLDVVLRFDAPAPASSERAEDPEPALSPEEIVQWDAAWRSWDAFLTFLIKLGIPASDAALGRELQGVLIEARYDLIEILASQEPAEADPVRPLFLSTWQRLAPLLRRLSTGLPGEEALHWATLIAAADAYAAIEAVGPELGIALSRDGLRRMARMVVDTPGADPTDWREEVDAELRDLFEFGPPLVIPEESDERSEDRPPEAEPTPPGDVPGDAADAAGPVAIRALRHDFALVANPDARNLDAWVPTHHELDIYLERVHGVLEKSSLFVQRKKRMPGRLAPLFRNLVLSTAWQETCWRQYVRRAGTVRPITSTAGALGIMQVNPHVWRGFYDVNALRSNTRYNADAGSEILHHYLVEHAIEKGEDEVRGDPDDLARATYAAYNAGPRQLARYRRPGNAKGGVGHRVDADFWRKFQSVRTGNELEVKTCYPGFSA